jgi:hypothetical protein
MARKASVKKSSEPATQLNGSSSSEDEGLVCPRGLAISKDAEAAADKP